MTVYQGWDLDGSVCGAGGHLATLIRAAGSFHPAEEITRCCRCGITAGGVSPSAVTGALISASLSHPVLPDPPGQALSTCWAGPSINQLGRLSCLPKTLTASNASSKIET